MCARGLFIAIYIYIIRYTSVDKKKNSRRARNNDARWYRRMYIVDSFFFGRENAKIAVARFDIAILPVAQFDFLDLLKDNRVCVCVCIAL